VARLAERARVVGVAAHEGRHVEGDREPAAPGREDHLVALVGLAGVAEPGELPDGPGPPPVAGRVQAAGERELPRPADALAPRVVMIGCVHRIDRQAGQRREVVVALAGRVVPCLPARASGLDLATLHDSPSGATLWRNTRTSK